MINLKDNDLVFAKVKPDAIIPTKKTENAGYDIYACFEEDFVVIPPCSTKLIPTGIASAVSDKYYLQVHERGSTGSKGMKYGAGVVDSSYRGEIFICINNINNYEIVISKLSEEELIKKHAKRITFDMLNHHDEWLEIHYGENDERSIFVSEENDNKLEEGVILYPYSKAIAQLVVHEVPVMNQYEITYEELLQITSERGIGALGSSGK